jgi:hypothetical protein
VNESYSRWWVLLSALTVLGLLAITILITR